MIEHRALGKGGPAIGCLGYGAMVLEGFYGASDDEKAIETIRRALDAGMCMINSADAYGSGNRRAAAKWYASFLGGSGPRRRRCEQNPHSRPPNNGMQSSALRAAADAER